MVKKTGVKKTTKNNPTLHGLLVSRGLSGTVVRVILFILLSGAVLLVGSASQTGYSGLNAIGTLGLVSLVYFVFDLLYIMMAYVRPWHPRLDRVVLPAALVFSLVSLYLPLVLLSDKALNAVNIWITAAVVLVSILGVRLALLMASTNR